MARKKKTPVWEQTSIFDIEGVIPPGERAGLVYQDPGETPVELKGKVRKRDHSTSVAAARTAKEISSKLKQKIIIALKLHGPMTDYELEALPEFKDYGESTVGKRRTELTQMKKPLVRWAYEKRPHPKTGHQMKVWEYCGRI